jgi:hypothetical protein
LANYGGVALPGISELAELLDDEILYSVSVASITGYCQICVLSVRPARSPDTEYVQVATKAPATATAAPDASASVDSVLETAA